jgi:hypothetical protein
MVLDPGSIIALTTIAYKGAALAWQSFQNTLHFSKESESLVVRLELERFRFQTWAGRAGLADGTLSKGLYPIHETIQRQLKIIEAIFVNLDKLREDYGLSAPTIADGQEDKVTRLIARMRKSLKISGVKVETDSDDDTEAADLSLTTQTSIAKMKRTKWGLRDKNSFEKLISELEDKVDKLNQLLSETQLQDLSSDEQRLNIIVVGNVQDQETLRILQDAIPSNSRDLPARALIERKAISEPFNLPSQLSTSTRSILKLKEFDLPNNFGEKQRFLARCPSRSNSYYLFEKKDFDWNISDRDKHLLSMRLQRLALLLSRHKSPEFRTLHCVGSIHDLDYHCWWLVSVWEQNGNEQLEGMLNQGQAPENSRSQLVLPVSLLSLFDMPYRPPLEARWELAFRLSATLSELFSSSWMHKGVRSDNVLFPSYSSTSSQSPVAGIANPTTNNKVSNSPISNPVLVGFNYSRQDAEPLSIDRSKSTLNLEVSLYRHPNYQGEAAEGYCMHYDVYSFGLVLVEIALWMPLSSFLDPVNRSGANRPISTSTVDLGAKMKRFQAEEAMALKKRVEKRVEREFAFRVGSAYKDVVAWCLGFADEGRRQSDGDAEQEEWHPALMFYNHVVEPLQMLQRNAKT